MKYDVIFWDIDGTLLDFAAAERWSLARCLKEVGIDPLTEELLAEYSSINAEYWKRLERGEVTRREVLVGRFRDFFAAKGITADPVQVNDRYQQGLGLVAFENENAIELCRNLKGKVSQYAATNGTKEAQTGKLEKSGLDQILDDFFISEDMGYDKPSKEYFDCAFAKIPEKDRNRMMIVGDSLTSDVKGGLNAGITAVWYNPAKKANKTDIIPDYEIASLAEIPALIGLEEEE